MAACKNYCFGLKVGVAQDRRSRNAFKGAAITKQYTLVNPRDYYYVMSVLRSFEAEG